MSCHDYKRTKLACYCAYFTMSSIFSLPPLLFVTFRETFGISYTLLGTLVLVNFCTQLFVDLIFTAFSKHFNVKNIVRIMPLITTVGLASYAILPTLFPNVAYLGLLVGTIIFSLSAGLSEVLLSPVIASIPSKTPDRDMSMLHSLYAFGVLFVVAFSTVFLKIFGQGSWAYLTLTLAAFPIIAAVMFMTSPMPDMESGEAEKSSDGSSVKHRSIGLLLCVLCIFFGSCAENAMSNWISGYMETALVIDKALGDILGMASFAVLLGVSRIMYAKYGKNICRVLMMGMVSAAVCYVIAALSNITVIALLACVLTGAGTAMLWPGSLIMMEDNVKGVGVSAFALMAAGGDLGASLSPQLLGIVVDSVSVSDYALELAIKTGLTTEQIGMKAGMLVTAIFPIVGIVVLSVTISYFKKQKSDIK